MQPAAAAVASAWRCARAAAVAPTAGNGNGRPGTRDAASAVHSPAAMSARRSRRFFCLPHTLYPFPHRLLLASGTVPTMAKHGLAAALPLLLLLTVLLLFLVALAPSSPSVDAAGGSGRRRPGAACTSTYTLRVKTACGSPAARTTDAVSVAFGDAYRNEVLARPLVPTTSGGPGSSSRALERCGTDTFRVAGPCGYGVCYLYLRRDGRDGWAPEWVQVVQPGPPDRPPATATFYFGDTLPDGVWYGHDRCPKAAAAAAAAGTNSSASPRG